MVNINPINPLRTGVFYKRKGLGGGDYGLFWLQVNLSSLFFQGRNKLKKVEVEAVWLQLPDLEGASEKMPFPGRNFFGFDLKFFLHSLPWLKYELFPKKNFIWERYPYEKL